MGTGMFMIRDDGTLVPMTEQAYNSEDLLQQLIAEYPDLLAGDQIGAADPRRFGTRAIVPDGPRARPCSSRALC